MEAKQPQTLEEILGARRTGKYYIGNDEPDGVRMARAMLAAADELGHQVEPGKEEAEGRFAGFVNLRDPMVIGHIVRQFLTSFEVQNLQAITLERVTKTEDTKIREVAKKSERRVLPGGQWAGGEVIEDDYRLLRVARAIVEPPVPGDSLRAKADWLADNMALEGIDELFAASKAMSQFNLARIEEKAKN